MGLPKYEIGDVVIYQGGEEFIKGERLKIIDIDKSKVPYHCENREGKKHWLLFNDISLNKPKTNKVRKYLTTLWKFKLAGKN